MKTIVEMHKELNEFCEHRSCDNCPFFGTGVAHWCDVDIPARTEAVIEPDYKILCSYIGTMGDTSTTMGDTLTTMENALTDVSEALIHDVIKQPAHYCREGAMECIDEMILLFGKEVVKHFCLCNVFKYRYRANDKNGKEDIEKSDQYIRIYKRLCSNE